MTRETLLQEVTELKASAFDTLRQIESHNAHYQNLRNLLAQKEAQLQKIPEEEKSI